MRVVEAPAAVLLPPREDAFLEAWRLAGQVLAAAQSAPPGSSLLAQVLRTVPRRRRPPSVLPRRAAG
jgi:hypothetical protein